MRKITKNGITILFSLLLIVAAITHGFLLEVSIVHGLIIHPIILVIGLSMLTFVKASMQKSSNDK